MPLTPEQIAQMDADLGLDQPRDNAAMIAEMDAALGIQPQQEVAQDPSLGDRISDTWERAGVGAQEAFDRYAMGEQGLGRTLGQAVLGNVVAPVAETVFSPVMEAGQEAWDLIPEGGQEAIKSGASTVGEGIVGATGWMPGMESYRESFGEGLEGVIQRAETDKQFAADLKMAMGGADLIGLGYGAKALRQLSPSMKQAVKDIAKSVSRKKPTPSAGGAPRSLSEIASTADDAAKVGLEPKIKSAAWKKVEKVLKKDFPDNYEEVIQSWKSGKETLAELYGKRTTSLQKGAAQYPSGQAKAAEFFEGKVEGVGKRIGERVKKSVSVVDDYHKTVDDLMKSGQKRAEPYYEKAMKWSNTGDERLAQLNADPTIQEAMKRGVGIKKMEAQAAGKPLDIKDFAITQFDEAGAPIITDVPNMQIMDAAKRGLDDMIAAETNALGKVDTPKGRALISLKKAYTDRLDAVNPAYGEARKVAGDYFKVDEAIKSGRKLLDKKTDPEFVKKSMAKMTPAEKGAYKIGVGKQIREMLDNTIEGRNPYNQIFGTPAKKAKLAQVLSPKEFKALEKSMKAENSLFKMRNEVLGGSPTTSKAVAAGEVASTAGEVVGLMSGGGDLLSMGKKAILTSVKKMFDGINDDTAEAIARILYETDPVKKLAMLEGLGKKSGIKAKYFKAQSAFQGGKKKVTDTAKRYIDDESGALGEQSIRFGNKSKGDGDRFFNIEKLSRARQQNDKSRDIMLYLTPDEFLSIARNLETPSSTSKETLSRLVKEGKKFDSVPILSFKHNGKGIAEIMSHEGRHRAMKLKELGIKKMPVLFKSEEFGEGQAIRWGSQGKGEYDRISGEWPKILKQEGAGAGKIKFPIPDLRD